MDPPVDVPATPTRCIFGQLSRVILGRRMRKRKNNKKERKKVDMFTQLFRQIVYTFENVLLFTNAHAITNSHSRGLEVRCQVSKQLCQLINYTN